MRLNDWKREAEEYRDVDRAALERAEAAMKVTPRRKNGRCSSGAERGRGYVYHAVPGDSWTALCGSEPGRLSAGWNQNIDPDAKVTCSRCLKKMAA